MKFFHTADWHLGKLIHGVYMTEDQAYVLKQLVHDIAHDRPDAVIVAGDIYDRAVPPIEAVELLNDTLEKIVLELDIPVLAISGNHDSPDRLAFGRKMMESRGLYIAGNLRNGVKTVRLTDTSGEVHFHLLPYADPAFVRHFYSDDEIRTHNDAMQKLVEHLKLDPKARHVCVGHAFVTPHGEARENTSDSERPLSIGGAEHVHAEHFASFHYTALGHLHQRHYVHRPNIRYAGSPLKYSASEAAHNKGYTVVEIDEDGSVTCEERKLNPKRDLVKIEARMEDILQLERSEDYAFVTLTDETPVLFPMEKIRTVYPNAMHVERKTFLNRGKESIDQSQPVNRFADPEQLFAAFYGEVSGIELDQSKRNWFSKIYKEVLEEEGK